MKTNAKKARKRQLIGKPQEKCLQEDRNSRQLSNKNNKLENIRYMVKKKYISPQEKINTVKFQEKYTSVLVKCEKTESMGSRRSVLGGRGGHIIVTMWRKRNCSSLSALQCVVFTGSQ